ncbi:uncharacterized protein LOC144916430 [Branchiostoma floridae x Branchiostoma belcheri]
MGSSCCKVDVSSYFTTIDTPEDQAFGKYDFPFENLVMEGGGVKGIAYIGALRVLESAGILKKIKRVAGSSSGAVIATLVALGLNCEQMAEIMMIDMRKILFSGGLFERLIKPCMFFRRLGWDTGNGFYKYCGNILKRFTGNPDITFKELYDMTGKELCIVVTNLDQQTEEYCHVKTTPYLPIRNALRMSMSLPVLFQPVVEDYFGDKTHYVDGGAACNYPLHCFDGWWLSMEEQNSFFNKLVDLTILRRALHRSERFEPMNPKTVGILLYSDEDIELFWDRLTEEEKKHEMSRKYKDKRKMETIDAMINRKKMQSFVDIFLTDLKNKDSNSDSQIDRQEMHSVFDEACADKLCGDYWKYSVDQLFDQMDTDRDGQITYLEVHEFFGNKGFHWLTGPVGNRQEEGTSSRLNLLDYAAKYLDLFHAHTKKIYHKADDMNRTIGVDSDYVKTTDFKLKYRDKIFLFKRGASGARGFLRTYITNENLHPRRGRPR